MGAPADPPPASPCGIDSLPTELLVVLFRWCAAGDALANATLEQVCPAWRALLRETNSLWTHIVLDTADHSIPVLRTQAAVWSARAAPLSVDVDIVLLHLDSALPLLLPFLPELARWRSCTVVWHQRSSRTLFPTHLQRPAVLEIVHRDPLDFFDESSGRVSPGDECLPIFHNEPSDADLSLSIVVSQLPDPAHLMPSSFTTLRLEECSGSGSSHPRRILQLLQAFPQLEVFSWTAWPHEFTSMDDLPAPFTLPRLRMLQIRGSLSLRHFLHPLRLPALETLLLRGLNVHITLLHLVDYASDGDSSDDAADFSQSPSSDHATGMALRALMRRSRPPLRVVDFDYVDMRTKDFAWCFDRWTDVRELRVVGSDMSNRVINLLRPRLEPDAPTDVDAERREQEQQPTSPICMPNLVRLNLTGALRVSGDAAVDALCARELFLREHPDAGSPLENLRLFRCPQLTIHHRDQLAEVFGDRLEFLPH